MISRIHLSKVTIVKGDFSPRRLFSQEAIVKRYPEYICPRDICLKGHLSKGILFKGIFIQGDFVQGRHLSKGTLVQGNSRPRRLLSKSHLVTVVLCIQQATKGEG